VTAQALADHAFLFLGGGILVICLAVAAILAAARLGRRYRKSMTDHAIRLFEQVNRIPRLGPALAGARVVVPTRYVALHLTLGLVATAAIVGFLVIAEEVVAGRAMAEFDVSFADALWNNTSPRWQQIFVVITTLGSTPLLVAAGAVITGGLLLRRYYVLVIGWIIGQAGGSILNVMLKNAFERTRPEFADTFLITPSWSFPSGHAMNTFVFCGLGVYVLLRFTRSWTTIAAVVTGACAWCLVMGFTRLYLGVHFLSDVVAGLIAATAWVAVCVSGIEVALRRSNRT
jgi:membrane-associated phospholipid phosphatase